MDYLWRRPDEMIAGTGPELQPSIIYSLRYFTAIFSLSTYLIYLILKVLAPLFIHPNRLLDLYILQNFPLPSS